MAGDRGLRVTQYMHAELAVVAAEAGGIRFRWLYGLRLLRDEQAMSPGGGGLRHGVGPQLVTEARARGLKLSERELQRRIQCARTYPTEAQIRNAITDFKTWLELIRAGFPPYEAPAGEPLADHRTTGERARDAAKSAMRSTLKELYDFVDRQDATTANFAATGRKRRAYLDELSAAVDGDLSRSWEDAHRAAYPDDPDGAVT